MQNIYTWYSPEIGKTITLHECLEFFIKTGNKIIAVIPTMFRTENGYYTNVKKAIIIYESNEI